MKRTQYKNAIENKKRISTAYLTLLTKNSSKLSVTEIVNLAKINRSTFYLHFNNLQEVEKHIEQSLIKNFKTFEIDFRQVDIDQAPEVVMNKLNEIFLKDIQYYKLILSSNDNNKFMQKIKNAIVGLIENNFKVMQYVTVIESFNTVVQYVVGGVINAYAEWFKGNIQCDIHTLSKYLSKLIRVGLKGYINY